MICCGLISYVYIFFCQFEFGNFNFAFLCLTAGKYICNARTGLSPFQGGSTQRDANRGFAAFWRQQKERMSFAVHDCQFRLCLNNRMTCMDNEVTAVHIQLQNQKQKKLLNSTSKIKQSYLCIRLNSKKQKQKKTVIVADSKENDKIRFLQRNAIKKNKNAAFVADSKNKINT